MTDATGGAGPEIVRIRRSGTPQRGSWTPRIGGPEFEGLLQRELRTPESRTSVREASVAILGQCVPPTLPIGRSTGLVVGYIQSGKTLSFTAVTALANDNDFRLIVVIAGTTKELSEQSRDRLIRDLRLNDQRFGRWIHIHNPGLNDVQLLRDAASVWDDPDRRDDRRAVLVTVLKNHRRLSVLADVLSQVDGLRVAPSLIVDDEADQASLNTLVKRGDLSSTYRELRRVRSMLTNHTFLQYTATPQANLLINLIDVLSPDFPWLLEPGTGYVGGATFFAPTSPWTRIIPPTDIPDPAHPPVDPPESLHEAMRLFFVGAASGMIRREDEPRNRSMMVHPSREINPHGIYSNWIQAARTMWSDWLRRPEGDPDREELVAAFRRSYEDIRATQPDIEPFDQIRRNLLRTLMETEVRQVNSRADKRGINWGQRYAWILVGGQVLDRGFTVEGLTVTYMPRGPGVGQADTIQQRARFLGYKRPYLGFCRVYVEQDVYDALTEYVEHERSIRGVLARSIADGTPLKDVRRVFLLDRSLRPTREAVIDISVSSISVSDDWCWQEHPVESIDAVQANRQVVDAALARLPGGPNWDAGHPERSPGQRHRVWSNVPLAVALESLIVPFQCADAEDSMRWTALTLVLSQLAESTPDAMCTVYRMRPALPTRSSRATHDGRIDQLFQGADATPAVKYPGDRAIHGDGITIQVHRMDLYKGRVEANDPLCTDVPILAVWVPAALGRDAIVQLQGRR